LLWKRVNDFVAVWAEAPIWACHLSLQVPRVGNWAGETKLLLCFERIGCRSLFL
jgi:hypothetical protein